MRLFRLFQDVIEVIDIALLTSNTTKSTLFIFVIGHLSLLNYLPVFALFLDYCYIEITNIKLIKLIITGNKATSGGKVVFIGSM